MPTRRRLLLSTAAAGLAGLGTLTGCSRGGGEEEAPAEDALRMRVWSEAAASAYETSLAQFTDRTGIAVALEVLPWEEYWSTLPLDVAAESLPDVLWMNTAQLAQAQQSGQLLDIGEALGDLSAQWEQVPTDLYRREDALWAVPQVYDQSLLLAHDDLLAAAGVDPAALAFDPAAPTDPLRDAARALTADGEGRHPGDEGFDAASRSTFGFSAHPDRTAVIGPFIAGNGGTWQDEEESFVFASEQGIAAVQYLADLAGEHLAPAGGETAAAPNLCRDLFGQGRLGLLQSGTYDLGTLSAAIDGAFPWSVHPVVAGPHGPHPVVHAIGAVGIDSDDEERAEQITALLEWLGGVDGQRPLAAARIGIPAHRDLRAAWVEAWAGHGVDVSTLAVPETVARPETGLRSAEAVEAAMPVIAEVFTGQAPAADALPRAQQAAEEVSG